MALFNNPLKNVRIASPCNADWDQMIGDERVRFCGQCSLNVYNLSGMTRKEAVELIEHNEGRLCIRYFKRADGSVITKNCPVGLQAIRRRMSRVRRAVSTAVLSFFAGLGFHELISRIPLPFPIAPLRRQQVMGVMVERPPVVMGDMVGTPPVAGPTMTVDPARPFTMGKMVAVKKRSKF